MPSREEAVHALENSNFLFTHTSRLRVAQLFFVEQRTGRQHLVAQGVALAAKHNKVSLGRQHAGAPQLQHKIILGIGVRK